MEIKCLHVVECNACAWAYDENSSWYSTLNPDLHLNGAACSVPSAGAEARLIIRGQFLRMCLFVYLRIYLTRMNIGAVCLCPGHHHWSPPDLDTPPLTSSQTSATHRHSHIQYSSICKPVFPVREERNEIVSFLSEHDYLSDIIAGFVHGHRSMVVWQTYILKLIEKLEVKTKFHL